MRYIANDGGRVLEVSFGADIQCGGRDCTQYVGDVPAGYDSLADWFAQEADKLYRWYIVDDQLTLKEDAPEPVRYESVKPTSTTLLWENASPTSSFAAQTIALDLLKYSVVVLEFALANNDYQDNVAMVLQCPVGKTVVAYKAGVSARRVYTKNSGIEFAAATSSNAHNIPLRIYGVKGVQGVRSAICGTFVAGDVICGQ